MSDYESGRETASQYVIGRSSSDIECSSLAGNKIETADYRASISNNY